VNEQRISIIIPAYNEERYLAQCLDSIAAQTVRPYEVIVVDNNSTDKTAEIAGGYDFVKLVRERKQGIVYARNAGFNAARGAVLARTDADVVLPADWVARIAAFYADDAHVLQGISGNGRPNNLRFSRFLGWLQGQLAFRVNRLLLGHYIFFGSNMALPATAWQRVKSDVCSRIDIHEDLDLAIHFHRAGYAIAYRESLQVTGRAARLISNRQDLLPNLLMWPKTLRTHDLWTWVFGWLGAYMLYALWPVPVAAEKLARLFGKEPIRN
jgi:glycosyltransferase involved in cell wall biosynthesis